MTTNNLPGFGLAKNLSKNFSQMWLTTKKKHHWIRKYHRRSAQIKRLENNTYSIRIPISDEEIQNFHNERHQYMRLNFASKNYIFKIKSANFYQENNNLVNKQIVFNENFISNSSVGSINNITNINNTPVVTGPLISFGPNGIVCVGCNTYGLVDYTVIFPNSTPLVQNEDPFLIDGAGIFFI